MPGPRHTEVNKVQVPPASPTCSCLYHMVDGGYVHSRSPSFPDSVLPSDLGHVNLGSGLHLTPSEVVPKPGWELRGRKMEME